MFTQIVWKDPSIIVSLRKGELTTTVKNVPQTSSTFQKISEVNFLATFNGDIVVGFHGRIVRMVDPPNEVRLPNADVTAICYAFNPDRKLLVVGMDQSAIWGINKSFKQALRKTSLFQQGKSIPFVIYKKKRRIPTLLYIGTIFGFGI